MSQAAAPAPDAGKKKKGKGKLLVILVATLVLALGGGGAAWFFMARADAANAARQKTAGDHGAGHANGEEADSAQERLNECNANHAVRNRSNGRADHRHIMFGPCARTRHTCEDRCDEGTRPFRIGKRDRSEDHGDQQRENGPQHSPRDAEQPLGETGELRGEAGEECGHVVRCLDPGAMDLRPGERHLLHDRRRRRNLLLAALQTMDQRGNRACRADRGKCRRHQDEHPKAQTDNGRGKPAAHPPAQKAPMDRIEADHQDDGPKEKPDERDKQPDAERNEDTQQQQWQQDFNQPTDGKSGVFVQVAPFSTPRTTTAPTEIKSGLMPMGSSADRDRDLPPVAPIVRLR